MQLIVYIYLLPLAQHEKQVRDFLDMSNTKILILSKEEDEIKERIKRIETRIPQLNLDGGLPTPKWEITSNLSEQMQKLNVPGINIAVINNFEIEWTKCFGVKDIRTQEQVSLNTLFEAGSATKTLVAVAVLNEVEKNLLDLDVSVNDKLRTWKIPDNEFTKENKVTLRQLITHSAGINRPSSMFGCEEGKTPTIEQILNGESPAKNDPVEVGFVPGKGHEYSNIGYIIIEKLLEDITGKKLSEIIEEVVLKPLEMNNSTVEYPSEELKKKSIVPHDDTGEAKETGLIRGASAPGGLLTTPLELGKILVELMKAYHGKSSKILSSEMVKQMFSSQVPQMNSAKFFGFTGQGLGIFLIEDGDNLLITHPGTNMPGATCMMIANVKTGHGAVIMANGINGELLNLMILFAIVKEYQWSSVWIL